MDAKGLWDARVHLVGSVEYGGAIAWSDRPKSLCTDRRWDSATDVMTSR